MDHPYETLYKAKEVAIIAGARAQLAGPETTLGSRLREMAYYLTERQQTGADAMFVMDLHEVVNMLEGLGKYHTVKQPGKQ